ncbi:ferritin heavy chain-like [Sarcophilus harrisii]
MIEMPAFLHVSFLKGREFSQAFTMSYYFNCDDVALKNFVKYFLPQSHEEREHAEKLMKLQISDCFCGHYCLHNVKQWLLKLHKLATGKIDPHLCDFIKTHYLVEQVKSIKQLGDHVINLCRGSSNSGTGEYLFDKHNLRYRYKES